MKIGFIGTGNMGSAIIGGIIKSGIAEKEDILAADASEEARRKAEEKFGINTSADNKKVAAGSDILFLAVKPQFAAAVIDDIRDRVTPALTIVSIMAGKSLGWLKDEFNKPVRLIRVMPNTPALVLEGMAAVCPDDAVDSEMTDLVVKIFESSGRAKIVPEALMDAVTGLSGSSPAFVFMFIEALADGAVTLGMKRADAYEFAAQTVLGSAKMVLETKKHPGELKDQVCSPAGTTIAGVRALENAGFRSSVMEAVIAAGERSKGM
ncbi:MAG: pyrroline-5-carboxylate reductase [Lachnospiraceae bacterium]|jgi:pyrroline-5-carboxylate reductase|nr:pyrroline-5-carboxylate reductase [Lachnospiraceae bacterium]MEE3460537.1 pyrroline-5-carboxylate reductase [Lachnospiraceae bacterium]